MSTSIIDDVVSIKKRMEAIKNEETDGPKNEASPPAQQAQANPGVWSTGMKGSGVSQAPTGQQAPQQAEHYDPYGNPLYWDIKTISINAGVVYAEKASEGVQGTARTYLESCESNAVPGGQRLLGLPGPKA